MYLYIYIPVYYIRIYIHLLYTGIYIYVYANIYIFVYIYIFVFEYRSAITFSLQEFGSEIVVLVELKSSWHEVGRSFDYLAHGAAVGYARGCPCWYGPLSQDRPSWLHLCEPTFINPPIRHFVKKLSSVWLDFDEEGEKTYCFKSILALSSSRISRRMSQLAFCIAIKRHLESVSRISSLLLLAYIIASSRAMHAAAYSALLEDEPSSSLLNL